MTWRYRFADLLTDQDIADVQLSGVTMDQRIVLPGSLRGTVAIPNRAVADQVRRIVPDPTTGVPQTVCHVYRDADLWGSYAIWTAAVKVSEKGTTAVDLQGATLESCLYHRLVDQDSTFTQADQLDIARSLLDSAQNGWGDYAASADLRIAALGGASGVRRDRAYKRSEATSAGTRLEQLANMAGGFEYRIVTYVDPDTGTRERLWIWGYPTLGNDTPTHVYSLPGNLRTLTETTDLTAAATAFTARGDTAQDDLTDESQPVITDAPLMRVDLLGAGWPWSDFASDHQGVTDTAVLDKYAAWYAATRGGVVRTLQATVRLPEGDRQAAYFSPNRLGDRVRVQVVNDWWPLDPQGGPTFSRTPRVVGVAMTPSDRSGGQDIQELIFADDAADPTTIQGA